MWISERPVRRDEHPLRRLALEAAGLAAALAFLPEVAGARAGAVLEPHPGWIAVLLLVIAIVAIRVRRADLNGS